MFLIYFSFITFIIKSPAVRNKKICINTPILGMNKPIVQMTNIMIAPNVNILDILSTYICNKNGTGVWNTIHRILERSLFWPSPK